MYSGDEYYGDDITSGQDDERDFPELEPEDDDLDDDEADRRERADFAELQADLEARFARFSDRDEDGSVFVVTDHRDAAFVAYLDNPILALR